MGDQVRCTVRFEGSVGSPTGGSVEGSVGGSGSTLESFQQSVGSAHLETKTLIFRGGFRLAIPFKEISAISATDKLGVKPGMSVALIDVDDDKFRSQLAERAEVADGMPQDCDLIFVAAPERAALAKLAALRYHLKPNGALWVLRPKGSPDLSEMEVLDTGRAAGLVDTKVVAFSAALTATKFVIPMALRSHPAP